SRWIDLGFYLHQPLGILRFAVGEPRPSGDLLVRRADPDPAVPAHGPLRADTQMSARRVTGYWIAFSVVVALLIVAPLVLPEFWRRFLLRILIRGVLAVSFHLLIGYPALVSFGHSA